MLNQKSESVRYQDGLIVEQKVTKIVVLIGCLALTAMLLIFLFINSQGIGFDLSKSNTDPGQLGDLIGGVSGPFIAIFGVMTTFLAFWIQYRFNLFQSEKIDEQAKQIDRNRFEGLFHEMLRIHRENVSEITIKDISKSRRAFISMFKEFKFCYLTLERVYGKYHEIHPDFTLDPKDIVNISYITFFYGIGESSEDIVNSLLDNYPERLRELYFDQLRHYQSEWKSDDAKITDKYEIGSDVKENEISWNKGTIRVETLNGIVFTFTTGYKPFSGHLARLGHYFRHLFQTVHFIDRQEISGKADYVRTLRAQISAHEQLLLYYNSLTVMGRRWWDEGFINEYAIIKNMPLPLANIGPDPIALLGNKYFEWSEIREGLSQQS